MVQYYYTDGKERFGPFSIEELKDKSITAQTLVWKEGLPDWVPANTLSDLNVLFPEQPQYAGNKTFKSDKVLAGTQSGSPSFQTSVCAVIGLSFNSSMENGPNLSLPSV